MQSHKLLNKMHKKPTLNWHSQEGFSWKRHTAMQQAFNTLDLVNSILWSTWCVYQLNSWHLGAVSLMAHINWLAKKVWPEHRHCHWAGVQFLLPQVASTREVTAVHNNHGLHLSLPNWLCRCKVKYGFQMSLLIMDHVRLNFECQSSSSTISSSSGTPRRYRTLLHLQETNVKHHFWVLACFIFCPNRVVLPVIRKSQCCKTATTCHLYTIKKLAGGNMHK